MALISVPTASRAHVDKVCTSSDGSTSFTTNVEAENDTTGVSLKNAPESTRHLTINDILSPDFVQPEGYEWYYLRVKYGRAEKLYESIKENHDGYLPWLPCQKVITYERGKKFEKLVPIFKGNIFVFGTREQAQSLKFRDAKKGFEYVDFAYDHTNKTKYGLDKVMTIPFNQMLNFARAENVHHPWAHVVSEEQIHFRRGGLVRVTGGAFEGVVGRVARVFGQTRVIISIQGIMRYATAYVSTKNMVPIDEETNE